jgi:hypothetical protein
MQGPTCSFRANLTPFSLQSAGVGLDLRFVKPVLDDTHRAADGSVMRALTFLNPMDNCGAAQPWTFDEQVATPATRTAHGGSRCL